MCDPLRLQIVRRRTHSYMKLYHKFLRHFKFNKIKQKNVVYVSNIKCIQKYVKSWSIFTKSRDHQSGTILTFVPNDQIRREVCPLCRDWPMGDHNPLNVR